MLYCSHMLVCAHNIQSKTKVWTLRICGLLFLYISFGFGPTDTLRDTAVVKSISALYPSWQSFVADIVLTILAIAMFSVLAHTLLLYEKKHKAGKKIKKVTSRLERFALRNLLDILSILVRWSIAFAIALVTMALLQNIKLEFVPSFGAQPVVYSVAILGLIFIIESFGFWQNRLHHFFCIRIK